MNASHHSHHTRGTGSEPQQQQPKLAAQNPKRRRVPPPSSSLTASSPSSASAIATQQPSMTNTELLNNQKLRQNLSRPASVCFNSGSAQTHAQPLSQRGAPDADSAMLQMLAAVASNGVQEKMQTPPPSQPAIMEQSFPRAHRTDSAVSSTSTISLAEGFIKDSSVSTRLPAAPNGSAPLDLSFFQFTATVPPQTKPGTPVKQQQPKNMSPTDQQTLFTNQHQFYFPFQPNVASVTSSSNSAMNQISSMGMDATYRSFMASSVTQPTTSLVTVNPIQAPQHPKPQQNQQFVQPPPTRAAQPVGKQRAPTQPIPKHHHKTKQPPQSQTKPTPSPALALPSKTQAASTFASAPAPVLTPASGPAPQPIPPMPSKQELFLQYSLMTGYQDPAYEEHWSEYFGLPVYNACGRQYLFYSPPHMAASQPDQYVHLPALTRILFEN